MAPAWTQRTTHPQDAPFLFALYVSTRQEEVAGWGWPQAQVEAFLRMQHLAREGGHRAAHPVADDQVILLEGVPAGRLRVDRSGAELHLVDLALLPDHRGQGLGGALMGSLCEEADQAGLNVRLEVLEESPAVRLYQRHGFEPEEHQPPYLRMLRRPRTGLGDSSMARSSGGGGINDG